METDLKEKFRIDMERIVIALIMQSAFATFVIIEYFYITQFFVTLPLLFVCIFAPYSLCTIPTYLYAHKHDKRDFRTFVKRGLTSGMLSGVVIIYTLAYVFHSEHQYESFYDLTPFVLAGGLVAGPAQVYFIWAFVINKGKRKGAHALLSFFFWFFGTSLLSLMFLDTPFI